MSKIQEYIDYAKSLTNEQLINELANALDQIDKLGAKIKKLNAFREKTNKDKFDTTSESLPNVNEKSENKVNRSDRIKNTVGIRGRKKGTLNNATNLKKLILESNTTEGIINGVNYKVITLEQDDICPTCGEKMTYLGDESVLKYNYIPAKFEAVVYVKPKYACKNKKCNGIDVLYEPVLSFAFPRISVTTNFLTYLCTQKFLLGTPIYRLQDQLKYQEININYNSLVDYIILAGKKIAPLSKLILEKQYSNSSTKYIDETFQHLTKPGLLDNGNKRKKSYVYCSVDDKSVVYKFTNSRSADWLYELINRLCIINYYVTDDFTGYDNLPIEYHQNCLCHVRRRFISAYCEAPKSIRDTLDCSARYCLKIIDELFLIEREIKNKTIEEKYKVRNSKRVDDLIDNLKNYLDKLNPPQGSYMEDAKDYALRNWNKLWIYRKDGNVSITNQKAENMIKKAAMIRKNSIVFNNPNTAIANFDLLTLIQTAKLNNLNVEKYLLYVLDNIKVDSTDLECFLPWNEKLIQAIN